MSTDIKEQMQVFRRVLDKCLEEELGVPKNDSYESEGRENILGVLMPQIEFLFLDAVSQERKVMPKGIKNPPLNLDAFDTLIKDAVMLANEWTVGRGTEHIMERGYPPCQCLVCQAARRILEGRK
jgi:hypothetical protein